MNSLEQYQEFKKLLEHYEVSDRAKKALQDLSLVLLLAPTSTGKNTTIQHLLKSGKYYFIISDTTRQPRVNNGVLEQNGREYWFRSEKEFLDELRKGEFLEAEIIHKQQVSGVSIRELEKAKSEGKIAITDVEIKGVHHIVQIKPETNVIMLLPPNFAEWQKRITMRGDLSHQELKSRFESARMIFDEGLKHDYYKFVISDDVGRSAEAIDGIVNGQPNYDQGRGQEVIRSLEYDLNEKLKKM